VSGQDCVTVGVVKTCGFGLRAIREANPAQAEKLRRETPHPPQGRCRLSGYVLIVEAIMWRTQSKHIRYASATASATIPDVSAEAALKGGSETSPSLAGAVYGFGGRVAL
jgi:hypothetical protein